MRLVQRELLEIILLKVTDLFHLLLVRRCVDGRTVEASNREAQRPRHFRQASVKNAGRVFSAAASLTRLRHDPSCVTAADLTGFTPRRPPYDFSFAIVDCFSQAIRRFRSEFCSFRFLESQDSLKGTMKVGRIRSRLVDFLISEIII